MNPDDIAKKVKALPRMSEVVPELGKLLGSSDKSAASVATLVKKDPGLTANVLRVANSAQYGLRNEVVSIEHGIALLGPDNVIRMALTTGLSAVLPDSIPGYGIDAADFGRHSAAVGLLAERMSDALGFPYRGLAFTAGLLHDCGKLAIASALEQELPTVRELAENSELVFVAVEKQALGADHTEVGEALAKHWRLPKEIQWAIRWHHWPIDAPGEVDRKLVGLVHVADSVAHSFGYGAELGALNHLLDSAVLDLLHVGRGMVDEVVSDSLDQILALSQSFER